MKQFIVGTDEQYSELERRIRTVCVVYRDQEMPRGCQPSRADVAFEVDQRTGEFLLMVKGVSRYTGRHTIVQRWVTEGELRFHKFSTLVHWLRYELRQDFPELATPLTDYTRVTLGDKPVESTAPDADRLAEEIGAQIKGQEDCVKVLSRKVANHLARADHQRPLSIFAVGPTGVGKTQTAIRLGEVLTAMMPNRPYGFLRLDMNEYQEKHRVSQLLGAPPGYVGHGEGSQLLGALSANARSIVLFDEIEKAHPDILKALMNAMDAGRLSSTTRTASNDYTVDCRKAIFFFTSNLASSEIISQLEKPSDAPLDTKGDAICRKNLAAVGIAPELIGRIQSFLVFRPLSLYHTAEIAAGAIARVGRQWGLDIRWIDPSVVSALMTHPSAAQFGVRTLEYSIDNQLGELFTLGAQRFGSTPIQIDEGPSLVLWRPEGNGQ